MKQLLSFLAALAAIITRVVQFMDMKKQERRNEDIKRDPVGNFERRFGELQPDPAEEPPVHGAAVKGREAKSSKTGAGDLHD